MPVSVTVLIIQNKMHRNTQKTTTELLALHAMLIDNYEVLGDATKYYLATTSLP